MNARTQHGEIEALLPWYANGSLESAERRRVADHLEHCTICREELDFIGDVRAVLRVSAAAEQPAPLPRNAGFASLPAELQARVANASSNRPRLSRKRYLVPAMAASFLAAIGLGVALGVAWLDAPRFRTATSSNIVPGENHVLVAVRFVPDTALEELNSLLRRHDAVVVRGPDTNERWLLEFPLNDGDADALRALLENGVGIDSVNIVETHTGPNGAE